MDRISLKYIQVSPHTQYQQNKQRKQQLGRRSEINISSKEDTQM